MNIIIFDFEVFKCDTLLGTIIVSESGTEVKQMWSLNEIKNFYYTHEDCLWIGHNNERYDNHILEGVLDDANIFRLSKSLINSEDRPPKLNIKLYYIDLMKIGARSMYSLKMTEGASGKDISETEVDFNLDRGLTEEEKSLTESYNRDDLNQTYENFIALKDKVEIRLDLCKEFGLPLTDVGKTEAQLGSKVLGAKKIFGIEKKAIHPILYSDLELNNEEVKQFYMDERFKKGEHFKIHICGDDLVGGSGGAHSALKKFYCKNALYFDVSGYYNLTMINRDLLPRSLDEEGKKRYKFCYEEQLRLKKVNPKKRGVYKTVLLTVFGGMLNKYTDFYDPWKGDLVMIVGQLFIIDLLEKLEGKIRLVQTNTDGIIVEPLDWEKRGEVIKIVEGWEVRTGYVIKKVPIHDIWQRDVNCYMYKTEDGEIHIVGENATYGHWDNIFERATWQVKEPPILSYCVVDFLENGITPEETVKKYANKLRMFQYLCKKGSFDWVEEESRNESGDVICSKKVQNVNRAFAFNNNERTTMLVKHKADGRKSKVANLPGNIFVYDKEIISDDAVKKLEDKIDYGYYLERGYEKIKTFFKGWCDSK